MDFLGYMAAGGVERLAIIAAALLIVFWGYKLYVGGLRNQRDADGPSGAPAFTRSGTGPGVLFMGIGCTVLIITLVTGGGHLESAGEAYRNARGIEIASVRTPRPAEAVQPATLPEISVAEVSAAETESATAAGLDTSSTDPVFADTPVAPVAPVAKRATAAEPGKRASESGPGTEQMAPAAVPPTMPEELAAEEDPLDFANSRELGGRIVSVKSERATLQWSGDGE